MLPEHFFEIGSKYQVDNSIQTQSGAEKVVYAVRKDRNLYAAKIYRKFNNSTEEKINRSKASRSEFDAYVRTARSIIGRYVPTPVEMIQENKKDIGLIVSWRNGSPVADFHKRELIPSSLFDDLELSLLQLPRGIWLIDDSMADANVCYDGSSLWLAEPRLRNYLSYDQFKFVVNRQMDYLRENYST